MPRTGAILLALAAVVSLTGAVPQDEHRAHPDFAARIAGVKTLGLVAPVVDAYELDASGARVARPDWSELARDNVRRGLEQELAARGFAVKPCEPATPAAKEELREVKLLYEAVGSAIIQATYANAFPWKLDRFEYSVGDVRALVQAAGADALVFTYAVANISSGGRVVLQALGARGSGIDWLIVGIVDRGGDVLWFSRVHSSASDLRDPGKTAGLVQFAMRSFPRRAP